MWSSVSLFAPLFSTHFLDDTRLFILFSFAHTHSFHTQGVKRGDGGGRETQKEKTGEETAQQGTVLMCGNHHTRGEDKTRHGNGWTHKGGEGRGTHKGKGKGEDKAWLSQRHSPLKKKRKRQKDNERLKTIKSIA